MRLDEFDAFKGEIKQLCASLGKAYTDALGQAYWRVLRDIPLAELEANVERVLLGAGPNTKFPRPIELRTTPTVMSGKMDQGAMKLNAEVWREKFGLNAQRAQIEYRYCQYQRIIASSHDSSIEHSTALEASLRIIREHGDPRFFRY